MCYGLLVLNFLTVNPAVHSMKAIKRDLANVGDRQTPDAVWSQNPDVIRDIVSPGHISAKMD